MYLLDTKICLDFVDARNAICRERVREHFAAGLHLSWVTAAELLVGPATSKIPWATWNGSSNF
jgi:predicted nucleic acid-binding protein